MPCLLDTLPPETLLMICHFAEALPAAMLCQLGYVTPRQLRRYNKRRLCSRLRQERSVKSRQLIRREMELYTASGKFLTSHTASTNFLLSSNYGISTNYKLVREIEAYTWIRIEMPRNGARSTRSNRYGFNVNFSGHYIKGDDLIWKKDLLIEEQDESDDSDYHP